MTPNQSFQGFENNDHFLRVRRSFAKTVSASGELGWVIFFAAKLP